jgi:hypothetical protein
MPFDLIHTHNPNADALTRDQVQQSCPAAFTDHASPETSERYGFVSTANAIDILADHGFAPVRAIQKPVRKLSQLPFADHMITFAPTGFADKGAPDRAEIVLYNSHNGRSSIKLFSGCYRFICSNGHVAGEGFEAKARHNRLTANGFSDMVADQAQSLPAMMQRIERMKQTTLELEQIGDLAYNATKLRWDMEADRPEGTLGTFATPVTVHELSRPRRYADTGSDLWSAYNVAQEALIRGKVRIVSVTKRNPDGAIRKARPIASLPESVRINRQLWDMADAVA